MNAKLILRIGLIMAISFYQLSCSLFGNRSEETPKYEVMMNEGNKEIRSYSSYIVAKTTVKGEFKAAQGKAFRILSGYIFGENEKKQNISMTAPVVQGKAINNEKIAMTAPVSQSLNDEGWVMTFMMPSKYKMEDLLREKGPEKKDIMNNKSFSEEEYIRKKADSILRMAETEENKAQ